MAPIRRPGAASRHTGSIWPVHPKHKFVDLYNFGGNWRHIVKVEAIEAWTALLHGATILGERTWWLRNLSRHNR